ncbi:hypothetical protein NO1_1653 [Candidatus Termititenax aidoneus]|uniref:Phage tail fiber protein n=1 Tax=Termititenax aidoneus TaxID=2218524 RepID=A0A388TCC0_TERA1|nr:hypothetical protein NO1_1653 [Candidatus Termititenax aidoneus]
MASNYTDTTDADFTTGNYNIAREKPLSAAGVRNALHTKENVANKQVSSTNDTADVLDTSSSDSYYPSSKLAGKNLAALRSGKQDKIAAGTKNDIVAYSGTTAGTFGTLPRVTTLAADTISASDEKIPTEKAVATALSTKAEDGDALHKAGSETITGVKTFGTATEAAEPLLGKAKTDDATNSGVKFATEAQVYSLDNKKQDKLTAAQQNVLDSGITKTKVDDYDNYFANLGFFPKGTILAFSKDAWDAKDSAFKAIWKVCDGAPGSNTPNLVGRFLRGAEYPAGGTGGTNDQKIKLEVKHLPSHTHTQKEHSHKFHSHTDSNAERVAGFGNSECRNGTAGAAMANKTLGWYDKDYVGNALMSSETVENELTGGDESFAIDLPAYYTVIYIMKVN